jgi:hypothetical protein
MKSTSSVPESPKPIYTALKIDFSLDDRADGNIHILDIADGTACSQFGFHDIEQNIAKVIHEQVPELCNMPVIDGDIPHYLLSPQSMGQRIKLNRHQAAGDLKNTNDLKGANDLRGANDLKDANDLKGVNDLKGANDLKATGDLIWPLSAFTRQQLPALALLSAHNQAANTVSSTLIGVEMHKALLYILRAKRLTAVDGKRFFFWQPSELYSEKRAERRAERRAENRAEKRAEDRTEKRAEKRTEGRAEKRAEDRAKERIAKTEGSQEILDQINQIPGNDGFFIKALDRSSGGRRCTEVMYAPNQEACLQQLFRLRKQKRNEGNRIFVVEQAYAYEQRWNNKRCIPTGSAFVTLVKKPNQPCKITVVSAIYKIPDHPYLGQGKGSRGQFVSSKSTSLQVMSELSPQHLQILSRALNGKYQMLFQDLCADAERLDEGLSSYPVYQILRGYLYDTSMFNILRRIESNQGKPNAMKKSLNMSLADLQVGFLAGALQNHPLTNALCEQTLLHMLINLDKCMPREQLMHGYASLCSVEAAWRMVKRGGYPPEHMIFMKYYPMDSVAKTKVRYRKSLLAQGPPLAMVNRLVSSGHDMHAICQIPSSKQVGEYFAYAEDNDALVLLQAALLSDWRMVRIVILSRCSAIHDITARGYYALHYALGAEASDERQACCRILIESCRDALRGWQPIVCENVVLQHFDDHLFALQRWHLLKQLIRDADALMAFDVALVDDVLSHGLTVAACEAMVEKHLRGWIMARSATYEVDDHDRTLRQAVVTRDAHTVELLLALTTADPTSESATGKTAINYAAEQNGVIPRILQAHMQQYAQAANRQTEKAQPEQKSPATQTDDSVAAKDDIISISMFLGEQGPVSSVLRFFNPG